MERLSPSPFWVGRGVPASFFTFPFVLPDEITGVSAATLCACVSLCSSTYRSNTCIWDASP